MAAARFHPLRAAQTASAWISRGKPPRGRGACGRPVPSASGGVACVGSIAEIGLHAAVDLHRHRVAAAVQRTTHGDPDPALADAVFLDVGALVAVEADADAALHGLLVVVGTARVVAEAVGRGGLGHRGFRAGDAMRAEARGARGYPGAAVDAAQAAGRPSGAPRPSRSGSGSPSPVKSRDTEFRQWRSPVGGGPSGKTWPRWLPQRAQTSSTRTMPWLLSRT